MNRRELMIGGAAAFVAAALPSPAESLSIHRVFVKEHPAVKHCRGRIDFANFVKAMYPDRASQCDLQITRNQAAIAVMPDIGLSLQDQLVENARFESIARKMPVSPFRDHALYLCDDHRQSIGHLMRLDEIMKTSSWAKRHYG